MSCTHVFGQLILRSSAVYDALPVSPQSDRIVPSCYVQLGSNNGQSFDERGGPTPDTKQGKELSKGLATGSDSMPVPDVGGDVDTSGFKDLNKKPEEGTLSK